MFCPRRGRFRAHSAAPLTWPRARTWPLSCARSPTGASARLTGASANLTHHDRHRFAQNVDHLALGGPFSAFSTEVVCTLGTTSAPDAASAPAIGGIARHEGPTRRRHSARGLHVVQNPRQCRDIERSSLAGCETHTPQRPAQTNIARNFSLSFFEPPENVAIPTIYFRGLKRHQGNYVRHCLNP